MRYTIEQRQFIVTNFFVHGENLDIIRAIFTERFGIAAPKNESMKAMVHKWQTFGSVHNRQKGRSGRRTTVSTEENIGLIQREFEENHEQSLRRAHQSLNISKTTIHRVLKKSLKLKPYKTLQRHLIPERSIPRRLIGAKSLLDAITDDPNFIENVWFTDEAHFELSGSVNKQNDRHWYRNQPNIIAEKQAHSVRTTAWAAMNTECMPFSFQFYSTNN